MNTYNYEESYYPNGQIEYSVPLINGARHGEYKKYFEDGSIQFISHWDSGIKIDNAVLFYRNGMKRVEENFQSGLLHGKMKEYDSLGNLIGVVSYELGDKKNEISYFSNGQLQSDAQIWNDSILAYYYYQSMSKIP